MVRAALLGLFLAVSTVLSALGGNFNNLDRYTGQYQLNAEPEIVMSIFHTGDHLTVEWTRMAAMPLAGQGEHTFVSPDGKVRYVVTLDAGGRRTGFQREGEGHT